MSDIIAFEDRYLSESLYERILDNLTFNSPLYNAICEIHSRKADGEGIKNITIKRNGEMTFLPKGKHSEVAVSPSSGFNPVWKSQGRQSGSYGRVLRKLLVENGFEIHPKGMDVITDSDLEELVNALKGFYTTEGTFVVVNGRDISYYYEEDRYDYSFNLGTLGSSCMRHGGACYDATEQYYAQDPEHCEMLILKAPDKDRIRGRALVWHARDGQTYMDRIYSNDAVREAFKLYAHNQGWAHKKMQDSSSATWVFPDGTESSDPITVTMHADPEIYPYMDTLYYVKNGEYCTNDCSRSHDFYAQEEPDSQDGGYVWDDYDEQNIREEDSIYLDYCDYTTHRDNVLYCDYTSEYILERDMVVLANGDHCWEEYDGLVYLDYCGEYYVDDEVTYCDFNEEHYPSDEVQFIAELDMHVYEGSIDEAYENAGYIQNGEGEWARESELEF